jgi:HSF-type DNA-binding
MVIYDKDTLTKDIFPAYFKHSNFKSFARQLNFYGFRKIKSKDKDCCIYHHDNFQRSRADLLPHIQRQTSECHHDSNSVIGTQKFPAILTNMNEVNELREKVNTLTSNITSLHQEIADLKVLVASLSDVIQTHEILIRHPLAPQLINSAPNTITNSLHGQPNFDRTDEPHNEALKPQARQTSSPNHTSVNHTDSYRELSAYAYVAVASQDHSNESYPAKRQRTSPDESVTYGAGGTQHLFAASLHAASIPNTVHHDYESPHNRWPSEQLIENHRINNPSMINNNNNSQNNNNNGVININNQITETTTASLTIHDVECSADYDFGYEDVAWFALFEEDVSHKKDDPTAAPQA